MNGEEKTAKELHVLRISCNAMDGPSSDVPEYVPNSRPIFQTELSQRQ
jgi:hypothetical protein